MAEMDVSFELAQQLQGHESQVRCLCLLPDGTLLSGGLDSQVIMWKRPSAEEGFVLHKKLGHHSDFIYALAVSTDIPGSFYSASKDKTVCRVDAEGNPMMQYVGHEGPVCSVVERGAQLITGSWDGTAKVWDAGSGELLHSLDAGAHAVTVGVLPTGEIVTGSQDRTLRIFRGIDLVHKVDDAHADIIRAISVSTDHLITASNDNLLKRWSLDGCQMASLEGHQSFVYGITHAVDGKTLLSSSDDSTAKVWSLADMSCQQSIIHAGTVWQSYSLPNGDFATACADQIVRVFTTNPGRMAPEEERQTQKDIAQDAGLQAAAKGSSSSPMDSAVDISQMPTTVGKKNGEIKCFKEGPVVNAYSWNEGGRSWDKIGEVVGAKEEKVFYAGDPIFARGEYDFVWDVDMGPAHGMKKLPFNKGQNPMVVAGGFIAREQIDIGNQDQIRKFIMQNAGEEACGTAPLGAATQESKPKASEPALAVFPIQTHVNFKDGKFEPLLKKLLEFNTQVPGELQLSPIDVGFLQEAVEKLKRGVGKGTELRACEKEVIHVKLAAWPGDKLFPVMDLWRLFVCHPQSCDYFKGSDRGAPFITKVTELLATDVNGPLGLCCARYLANLFMYQTNRHACFGKREAVLRTIQPVLSSSNKHSRVAATTILLNHAIVLHEISFPPKPWDQDCAVQLAGMVLDFLDGAAAEDVDAKQRALFTLGTLLVRDAENAGVVKEMCKTRGLPAKLAGLEKDAGGPVIAELKKLLS